MTCADKTDKTANWLQQTLKLGQADPVCLLNKQMKSAPFNQIQGLKIARLFGELTNVRCKEGQTNDETRMINPEYIYLIRRFVG